MCILLICCCYTGSKVVFEEVGGRTTAIVPSVQLRTGALVSSSNTIAITKAKTVVVKRERKVKVETEGSAVSEDDKNKRSDEVLEVKAKRKSARTK